MSTRPRIENAPGLAWRPCKHGWEARWRARIDLIRRGYRPQVVRLWRSTKDEPVPTPAAAAYISDRTTALQTEMLIYGRGGIPDICTAFDGTVNTLSDCYQTDPDSAYKKKRYGTRTHYDVLLRMVKRDIGHKMISEITARDLLRWNEGYINEGHLPMGRAVIGMLRTLATFGATLLQSKECRELKVLLHDMRFPMAASRSQQVTAEQAEAIRGEAHKNGKPSVALAQALQFDLTLRQKDVIGEFVPVSEPGVSGTTDGNEKWLRGLDWKEIDENFILDHVTSKRQKRIVIDLKLAPMVMAELGSINRADHPVSGPVVVNERTGLPYRAPEFRIHWRKAAEQAGVPIEVKNMDSRAGAITEAFDAEAPAEDIRKGATHSNLSMTHKYSRGDTEAVAKVMTIRAAHRQNKTGS